MRFAPPKLRMWHLLGLVATVAAFLSVNRVRREGDPIHVQMRHLRYGEAPERAKAARELRDAGRDASVAVETLIGALGDPDARVRTNAEEALNFILREDRKDPRIGVTRDLLTIRLADRNERVRTAAAIALADLGAGPKLVVPRLIEAQRDPDAAIRRNATRCLEYFARGNEAARDAVFTALRDPAADVRTIALHVLRHTAPEVKTDQFARPIVAAAGDADPYVRSAAAAALGALRIATPRVTELLGDPDVRVRCSAAEFLRAPEAVPALIRALRDPHHLVRAAAADALGPIGADAEDALPALRVTMKDPNENVRARAASAYNAVASATKVFHSQTLPDSIANLADPDQDVRRAAADELGAYGPKAAAAVPALMRVLADRESPVRRAVARALGGIGPRAHQALPALGRLATDGDGRVRSAAETAQAAIRGAAASAH